MGLLSILGLGRNKIKDALRKGAVVIDVRTAHEFDEGKVPGSINIPVDRIPVNIERIRHMNKPVVLCCASGERSEKAAVILRAKGIKEVYNGGSWLRIVKMMRSL
jgi:phage shock protein E